MARGAYPTPPRTPRKAGPSGGSLFNPRNVERLFRLVNAGARAAQALGASKSSGQQAVIESTTAQGDKQNISLRKNRKRVAKARRRYRAATRMQKSLVRLRPNRTYGTTYHFANSITAGSLNALVTRRDGSTIAAGLLGRQAVAMIPLLTYSKNDSKPSNDLNNIIEISASNLNADTTQTTKYKILVKSFFQEIMMKNTGTNACYVDLYYFKVKRTAQTDVFDLVSSSDAQVADDGPAAIDYINYAVDQYGWTPYQNKDIMKYIRIFKKERYYLQPGGTSQIEWRARVNKYYFKDQTDSGGDSVQGKMPRGIAHGIFAISYGTPESSGENGGNNQITGIHTVKFAINRNVYWQNLTVNTADESSERAIVGVL